jgi:hypothetical protein
VRRRITGLSLSLLGLVAIPLALGSLALRAPSSPPVGDTVTATDYALAAPDTLHEGAVTFRLTSASGSTALPRADLTMSLRDYSFVLSGAPAPGRRVIEVRNDGDQTHEVELVQLAPGKSVHDVLAWVEKPTGSPPGLPLGGVSPLARGGVASFEVELAPGRYGMICFLPDTKDGKPHHEHGMIQEFEVPAKVASR